MKQHQGIWLPDHETHLIDWMNKSGEIVDGLGTYQIKKLRAALEYVKQWRTACDIGGHCGLFSMHLAKRFRCVHAFEPVPEHIECFRKNVPFDNVALNEVALGAARGYVSIQVPDGSSGGAHVVGGEAIELLTLDCFGLVDVDFIKCDVEGFELAVMEGAQETIELCRPIIMIEQKSHTPGGQKHISGASKTPAVDYLKTLGYTVAREMSGDFIMVTP